MRLTICSVVIIVLFSRCESKVEIPINHAGVVVTGNTHVEQQVLKAGEHKVNSGSEVIIYDLNHEELELEFDFLFKDVSAGDVKLVIEFTPKADSLPSFYRMSQSIYVTPVIHTRSRRIVRNLLENYDPQDFTIDELKSKIVEVLTNDHDIINYVKVNKVNVVDLKW